MFQTSKRSHWFTFLSSLILSSIILPSKQKFKRQVYGCKIYFKSRGIGYNISNLKNKLPYSSLVNSNSKTKLSNNSTLTYNFCTSVKPINKQCKNQRSSGAIIESGNECLPLTSKNTSIYYKTYKDNGSQKDKGIFIFFNNSKTVGEYDLLYNFICSPDHPQKNQMKVSLIDNRQSHNSENSLKKLKLASERLRILAALKRPIINVDVWGRSGCEVPVSRFLIFVDEHYYIFSGVFILSGFFIVLYGAKSFKWGFFMLGMHSGLITSMWIILIYWNYKKAPLIETVGIFTFCGVIGLLVGLLLGKYHKLGLMFSTSIIGFFIGSITLSITEGIFGFEFVTIMDILIICLFILILFVIGLKVEVHAVIICQGITGSLMIVRGVGMLMGRFPDAAIVLRKLRHNEEFSISWTWLLYLVSLILLSTFSIVIQYFFRLRESKRVKEDSKWKTALQKYQRESRSVRTGPQRL